MRLGVVLEQCLAPVPGGTGRYSREIAAALARSAGPHDEVTGVVAWHRATSAAHVQGVRGPRRLPLPRRGLVAAWERGLGPRVPGDVVLAPTPLFPPAGGAPCAVVVHDAVPWTHPETLTPRAKTHNYLNLVMGDLEVRAQNPDAWAVLLDMHGNLCEGLGSNIFIVRDGEVLTPREHCVLPGVSRATAMELAVKLGIPLREADIDLYDAYNADEAFITSTSLCICPVQSINGVKPAAGVYGPVTQRLIDAYVELVDFDFVQQYLDQLE